MQLKQQLHQAHAKHEQQTREIQDLKLQHAQRVHVHESAVQSRAEEAKSAGAGLAPAGPQFHQDGGQEGAGHSDKPAGKAPGGTSMIRSDSSIMGLARGVQHSVLHVAQGSF